jgi:urease gamma subunit
VEVRDVIIHQAADLLVAAAVGVAARDGMAAPKLFTKGQKVLLAKDIQAVLGYTIMELQLVHTMAVAEEEALEIWATVDPTEINKDAVVKEWLVV